MNRSKSESVYIYSLPEESAWRRIAANACEVERAAEFGGCRVVWLVARWSDFTEGVENFGGFVFR